MKSNCEDCRWRRYSERKPDSFWAKLWRWHTRWCPGWKAYQRKLAEETPSPAPNVKNENE